MGVNRGAGWVMGFGENWRKLSHSLFAQLISTQPTILGITVMGCAGVFEAVFRPSIRLYIILFSSQRNFCVCGAKSLIKYLQRR